ncbi:MAG: ATP-binding protein [Ekhidna sp.]|nr:ATP-binding protein [Ekhidna sp.]MBC6425180.1 ATP-binding protein [Ekhidna sp.]
MDELKSYIINSKVSKRRISAEIRDGNNSPYPKRNLFVKLRQYSIDFLKHRQEPRMIALAGLRGVGKTTLLWQTAEEMSKIGYSHIYFINGNDLNTLNHHLYDTFQIFEEEIFGKKFFEIDHPVVFLIDEVHNVRDWDLHLKILYDKCKQAFVLITGSSALLLHNSADLSSRMTITKVFPFRYAEFVLSSCWIKKKRLLFAKKGLGSKLREILFYSETIDVLSSGLTSLRLHINDYLNEVSWELGIGSKSQQPLIDEYVSYHNIARFLPLQNKEIINDRIIALFERILLKDLPVLEEGIRPETLFRLLMRLALSDEVNYQSLSRDFGREKEIEHFIDLLDKAEILNVFLPHGGTKSKTGKNIKPFFMSPSLRRALYAKIYGNELKDDLRARLYEDIIAMYLRRLFDPGMTGFGFQENGSKPDFIVETRNKPIVLEVGVGKATNKQIREYQDKRYGIVINAKISDFSVKEDCIFMPLSWFLLL